MFVVNVVVSCKGCKWVVAVEKVGDVVRVKMAIRYNLYNFYNFFNFP